MEVVPAAVDRTPRYLGAATIRWQFGRIIRKARLSATADLILWIQVPADPTGVLEAERPRGQQVRVVAAGVLRRQRREL